MLKKPHYFFFTPIWGTGQPTKNMCCVFILEYQSKKKKVIRKKKKKGPKTQNIDIYIPPTTDRNLCGILRVSADMVQKVAGIDSSKE
jgi:hypothetical protein